MNNIESLDRVFQALADPTRRAVIQQLGAAGPSSTKALAAPHDMALPSFMQHLSVLEDCGLVASEKVGRVRTWQINPQQFASAEAWFAQQRQLWEERTDRFVDYVEDLERQRKQDEQDTD